MKCAVRKRPLEGRVPDSLEKGGFQALSVFCAEALSASMPADTTANAAET